MNGTPLAAEPLPGPGSAPLVPAPLYGLRTWRIAGPRGAERLAGPQQGGPWPDGGGWLEARCSAGAAHVAPAGGCRCGVHAWHPDRAAARRVVGDRRCVAGVVEARGAVELHEDGFRAQWARPHALFLLPGRNAALLERLGRAYAVPVVAVADADALLAWCRAHELGMDPTVVASLLGPAVEERRRQRRTRTRTDVMRVAAAIALIVALLGAGSAVIPEPHGDKVLVGRAGKVHVHFP